jgi:hypothetical protein
MKECDFPETFKTILKEMCKRVRVPYSKINFDEPEWYNKHCWSQKQQENYVEWMTNYLYTNSIARKEILNFPTKSKKQIERAVKEFVFSYGWKVCENKK